MPRIVYFGKYELIWECMEEYDCECGAGPGYHWPKKLPFYPHVLSNKPLQSIELWWGAIVEDFCTRALTKESDALAAISGAAKMIKQALQAKVWK